MTDPHRVGATKLEFIGPPTIVFGLFVGAWYGYSGFVLSETERNISIPYPHDVVRVSFFDGANRSELLSALWTTTWISLAGLCIAAALGFVAAVLMSQARWIERSLYPYAVLLQTVPVLALVPVIGLRFGFGVAARILVVAIVALFPIITNTLFGLQSPPAEQRDLFRLLGSSRMTMLFKLQLPAALPAMFTGLRISAGLAVIGEIVGGFFFGRGATGLGNRIQLYAARLRAEELIAAVALSALLGLVVFWLFGLARRQLTGHWDPSARPTSV